MSSLAELRVFKSLNCTFCQQQYSKTANDIHGPRQLHCGRGICLKCCKEGRWQDHTEICLRLTGCTFYEQPVWFLLEILTNPSILSHPSGNGYLLSNPFPIPECAICQEEYSAEGSTKPSTSSCGHSLCRECALKNQQNICQICARQFKFIVDTCQVIASQNLLIRNNNSPFCSFLMVSTEFLLELPEIEKQIETLTLAAQRNSVLKITSAHAHQCQNCQENFPKSQIFNCVECEEKVCGGCGLRKHRSHLLNDCLVEDQIKEMVQETKALFISEKNSYETDLMKQCETEQRVMFKEISSLRTKIVNQLSAISTNDFEKAKLEIDRLKSLSQEILTFTNEYKAQGEKHRNNLQKIHAKLDVGSNLNEKKRLTAVQSQTINLAPLKKPLFGQTGQPTAFPATAPKKAIAKKRLQGYRHSPSGGLDHLLQYPPISLPAPPPIPNHNVAQKPPLSSTIHGLSFAPQRSSHFFS